MSICPAFNRILHSWLETHRWTVLTAFGSMGLLPSLVLERPIYLRERADGLYRPITYLASHHATASPLLCLLPPLRGEMVAMVTGKGQATC